ncbi:hypothetical protein IV417_04365 [Alphaproteobacteria bacterium KMM 3653]|uniref:Stringent starvation protein B n=1 Tax=Harenicola maris TaxID=2841044 RepID=A0AAP2G7L0_9RHOB|nr:hypothetical protein [Harenicola maris]
MTRRIEYGHLMHNAMRSLIRTVLTDVAESGLPGEHHFFITIDTQHPEVQIADWLRQRYPEEITVVMQHWFDNLEVREDSFSVTLNFGDMPEPLFIPFDSIITFVDPSVEFGLRFEGHSDEDEDLDDDLEEAPMLEEVEPAPDGPAEVVSLDSFRK